MELRRPSLGDKANILDMIEEFEREGSSHDSSFWSAPSENFDYEDWLLQNQDAELGLNLPEGWVPSIQFVAFAENNGLALGFLNLRLRLNDYLHQIGGHIGYWVRPSQRNKGIAKTMLTKALHICQVKNIQQVLVTCHDNNPASRAVVLANGGKLEDIRGGIERYWIEVEKKDE
ncbi:GNAT family N-acetyltransferase [Streptococcus dentasini]